MRSQDHAQVGAIIRPRHAFQIATRINDVDRFIAGQRIDREDVDIVGDDAFRQSVISPDVRQAGSAAG